MNTTIDIDKVDSIEALAEMDTSFSIIEYYSKQLDYQMFMENTISSEDQYYQEGLKEAWASDTSAFKGREGESIIIRILKFLPRLFRNIVKWIWSKLKQFWGWLTKSTEKKTEKAIEEHKEELEEMLEDGKMDDILTDERSSEEIVEKKPDLNDSKFDVSTASMDDISKEYQDKKEEVLREANPNNYNTETGKNLARRNAKRTAHNPAQPKMQSANVYNKKNKKTKYNKSSAPQFKERKKVVVGLITGRFEDLRIINNVFLKKIEDMVRSLERFDNSVRVKINASTVSKQVVGFKSAAGTVENELKKHEAFLNESRHTRLAEDLTLDEFYHRIDVSKDYIARAGNFVDSIAKAMDQPETTIGYAFQKFKESANKNELQYEAEKLENDAIKKRGHVKKKSERTYYFDDGSKTTGVVATGNLRNAESIYQSDQLTYAIVTSIRNTAASIKNILTECFNDVANVVAANKAVIQALETIGKIEKPGKRKTYRKQHKELLKEEGEDDDFEINQVSAHQVD